MVGALPFSWVQFRPRSREKKSPNSVPRSTTAMLGVSMVKPIPSGGTWAETFPDWRRRRLATTCRLFFTR